MSKPTYRITKLKKGDALHPPCGICGVGPDVAPVTVCKCRATTYYIPGDDLSRLCGDAQSAKSRAEHLTAKYAARADEFPLVAKFPKQWGALAQAVYMAQVTMHIKPYDEDPNQEIWKLHMMDEDEAARMAEDLLSKIAALDVASPVS